MAGGAAGRRRAHAFTLIELLVVMAIVAALVTAVTLSVDGIGSRSLENQARRLEASVALACERALVTGRDYGIDLSAGNFRAGPLRDGRWQPLDGASGDPLRTRALDEGIVLRLRREGQPLPLTATPSPRPALACYASGELTPFELELRAADGNGGWRLRGAFDGTVALERIDAPG